MFNTDTLKAAIQDMRAQGATWEDIDALMDSEADIVFNEESLAQKENEKQQELKSLLEGDSRKSYFKSFLYNDSYKLGDNEIATMLAYYMYDNFSEIRDDIKSKEDWEGFVAGLEEAARTLKTTLASGFKMLKDLRDQVNTKAKAPEVSDKLFADFKAIRDFLASL